MPEGHTVHRLAAAVTELFGGQRLSVTSPQGRFAAGAELLDGQYLLGAQAHGKHFFAAFAPEPDVPWHLPAPARRPRFDAVVPPEADAAGQPETAGIPVTWLRIHLGLYGSWTFDGDSTFTAPHSIGAPRRKVGERGEHALAHGGGSALAGLRGEAAAGPDQERRREGAQAGGPAAPDTERRGRKVLDGAAPDSPTRNLTVGGEQPASDGDLPLAPGQWQAPQPRGAVRLRLASEHGVADLTGPAACEVLDAAEVAAVRYRLGPDPLREDGDWEAFVAAARGRRRSIAELLMDQSIIAGVGNIYRAEVLFRCGVSPSRQGQAVSERRLRALWDDLAPLMEYGVATGFITTVDADDVPQPLPEEDQEAGRWYVYHRAGRPCLRCGTPVAEKELAGRRLFWCPRCQAH